MKKIIPFLGLSLIVLLGSCGSKPPQDRPVVIAGIDLVNVSNDKVIVWVRPAAINKDTIEFYLPEIVPGTYADSDFGKFIEDFKAWDAKNNPMSFQKRGDNTWVIYGAKKLDKVTYLVNDTFDIESEHEIFSPSGTNFDAGKNFLLNLHAVVGYFEGQQQKTYELYINRPESLHGTSSLNRLESKNLLEFQNAKSIDSYIAERYDDLTDNPIMYNAGNYVEFKVGDITIDLDVYSPNGVIKAADLEPNLERMMQAQKDFLGDLNSTNRYTILLYLSSMSPEDAQGFGALEHNRSTTVVMPETIPLDYLNEQMTEVVSHEFFHIVTPLSIHSEEIHYFQYNNPTLSQNLWLYEGLTEYFANLFQVNQGLITEDQFYQKIVDKIESSRSFDDTMPFTVLSKNVLESPYKEDYYNVYLKGALINMCLDIIIRQHSEGKRGILDVMKELSKKYGPSRPFKDTYIMNEIASMTFPEVGTFFKTYVEGSTPIPYDIYFQRVALKMQLEKVSTGYFLHGMQTPYIDGDPNSNDIFFRRDMEPNSMWTELGIQKGDVIIAVNGVDYNLQNVMGLITTSNLWKEGDSITMKIKRDDQVIDISGKVSIPMATQQKLIPEGLPKDDPKVVLRDAWLKG